LRRVAQNVQLKMFDVFLQRHVARLDKRTRGGAIQVRHCKLHLMIENRCAARSFRRPSSAQA
jgi:hypothetical protein